MIYILVCGSCKCFRVIQNNFFYILQKHGIDSKKINFIRDENKITDNDIIFCVWNGLERMNLPSSKNYIIYNLDPMNVEEIRLQFTQVLAVIKPILYIDYSNGDNLEKVKKIDKMTDVKTMYMPYGYSSYHEHLYTKNNEKDIDILFYGSGSDRRKLIYQNIRNTFPDKNFVVKDNLYDENQKSNLVSRSKIVLSISSSNLNYTTNDLVRLSYLISNKIFVIAERVGDSFTEDKLSKYITFCDKSDMCDKIKYYLENENETITKSEIAYDMFKKDFNMENELVKIITTFKKS